MEAAPPQPHASGASTANGKPLQPFSMKTPPLHPGRLAPAKLPEIAPTVDYERVYEPQEDTWLFCDALAAEAPGLAARRPTLLLEIGPGSGVVSAFLAARLAELACPVAALAVDVNAYACGVATETAAGAGLSTGPRAGAPGLEGPLATATAIAAETSTHAESAGRRSSSSSSSSCGASSCYNAVQADLVTAFASHVVGQPSGSSSNSSPPARGAIDVLLFNPPYVPTPPEEVAPPWAYNQDDPACALPPSYGSLDCEARPAGLGSTPLPAAWAGGDDGIAVLARLLPSFKRVLSFPSGVAYLVAVAENDPEAIARQLSQDGLVTVLVASRKAVNERLHILRVSWAVYLVAAMASTRAGAALPAPPAWCTAAAGKLRLCIVVTPNASSSEAVGELEGALKVRLAAPPRDGLANEELVAFLAKALKVPKRAVEVTHGATGRQKTVTVACDLSPSAAAEALLTEASG